MIVLMPKGGKTGKGQFISRLIPALRRLNVKIVFSPNDKFDLCLCVSNIKIQTKAKKILRLDGVYYNQQSSKHINLNNKLKKFIHKCDGIVYQSQFSRDVCNRYLGKTNKPQAIIYNGIDKKSFSQIEPAKSEYKHNFLAAARWRRFKRLKEIIKSFLLLNNDNSCLWIAGDVDNKTKHPRIKYLGYLKPTLLASYYKMADACIHISWVDACPNTVIESIGSGTPVICNNVGGTPEIVKNSGMICKIDQPYNFKAFDPYHCPTINCNTVSKAMQKVIEKQQDFDMKRKDIDINNIAQRYKDFFKEVLNV